MLHKAKKMNPEAIVVATGCYVQTGGEKLEKDEAIDLAVDIVKNIYGETGAFQVKQHFKNR